MRGDLSAILLRALHETPEGRYGSVSELAADVRNYLEQRPVVARPQTLWYRMGKFARRRRVGLSAAAMLMLLVAASGALLYQVQSRRQERKRQVANLANIVSQTGAMINDNIQKSRLELARSEAMSLRDTLEQLRRDNPGDPKVTGLLANSYFQLAQIAWFRYGPSLMDADMALDSYSRARSLFEAAYRLQPTSGTFQQVVVARVYQSEMLVEDGRGLDSFREVEQLLLDDEANLAAGKEPQFDDVANLAGYYDMLSDRLGGGTAWMGDLIAAPPKWYAALVALQPARATNAIAMQLYERSLTLYRGPDPRPSGGTSANVRLQLSELQHQAGLRAESMRNTVEAFRLYKLVGETSHQFGFSQESSDHHACAVQPHGGGGGPFRGSAGRAKAGARNVGAAVGAAAR